MAAVGAWRTIVARAAARGRGCTAIAERDRVNESTAIDIALVQINPVMGDIDGNASRVAEEVERLRAESEFRVAVLPELVLIGYPPDDLVLRPDMPELVGRALDRLA
ncbi:MAG: hypothetical protein GWO02_11695, partial [Gammaproteobacteria bacterium]|nr:hypothetical protein [Gammaproteobacteria bacterium]